MPRITQSVPAVKPMSHRKSPRVAIDRDGIHYETRRMSRNRAFAFARCLAAKPYFRDVLVLRDLRARAEAAWYVSYAPADGARIADLVIAEQEKRIETAEAQRAVMTFITLANRPGLYHVVNTDGHGTAPHEVDTLEGECSCEDFDFRCRGLRIVCHHLIEAKRREAEGLLPAPVPPAPVKLSAAERARRIQEDYS